MKIKIKDWKVWIIRAVYGVNEYNLPKTRCEFVKKFTASLAVFILCFPFLLYMLVSVLVSKEDGLYHNPDNRLPPFVFFFLMLFGLALGANTLGDYFFDNLWWTWPTSIVVSIVSTFLIILTIGGIAYGIQYLGKKIKNKPVAPKRSNYESIYEYGVAHDEYVKKLDEYLESKNNSAWGMLKSHIKAKKELFCPTIEYIDESGEK